MAGYQCLLLSSEKSDEEQFICAIIYSPLEGAAQQPSRSGYDPQQITYGEGTLQPGNPRTCGKVELSREYRKLGI